ncbi:6026_t:CDS:2 [Funneliformis mosseae]|uniref:6026_t:CDS:1 n=1 Tax=Funneliformis mosseae TaxID=27381 RepID=A0A9N9EJV6_FUNMO|nr:6026_t:CDS:2 [Funneliformis mosseae]
MTTLFTIGAEYERERLERIEQNRAILAKLGLDSDNLRKLSLKKPKPVKKTYIVNNTPENNNGSSEGEQEKRRPSRLPKPSKTSRDSPHKIRYVEKSSSRTYRRMASRNHLGRRTYGGRIYDSEHGTTCHQCRQKTIEDKVQCTNVLQDGSLCKVMMDERCLVGRYGQTLQDARESGEWSCPKCRDVCNCSFCRKKKGLSATGILKHVALKAGYNSVMEYLGDA